MITQGSQEELQAAIAHLVKLGRIVRVHGQYIIIAQDEQDYTAKVNAIKSGDVLGFYTTENVLIQYRAGQQQGALRPRLHRVLLMKLRMELARWIDPNTYRTNGPAACIALGMPLLEERYGTYSKEVHEARMLLLECKNRVKR